MAIKTGYHVDRSNSLQEGMVITLDKNNFSIVYEESLYFREVLKNGLSRHGMHFLYNQTLGFVDGRLDYSCINSSIMELHVELLRAARFPSIPSRYQSIFCLPSLNELANWPMLNDQNYPIYEIEYDSDICPTLDANFLRGGITNSQQFWPCTDLTYSEKYLSGIYSDNPRLEVIVPLPIVVGKRIR